MHKPFASWKSITRMMQTMYQKVNWKQSKRS